MRVQSDVPDDGDGLRFDVAGELYFKPTEDHLIGLLQGRLKEPFDLGIVTFDYIDLTVGVHSHNNMKWFTGNVTGAISVNPLGRVCLYLFMHFHMPWVLRMFHSYNPRLT